MKNKILIFSFLICVIGNTQCEKEILEKENYYYVGCLDYEGNPDGEGDLNPQSRANPIRTLQTYAWVKTSLSGLSASVRDMLPTQGTTKLSAARQFA